VEGEDDHGLYVWPATAQLTLLQVDLVPRQKNERKDLTGKDVPGSVPLERVLDRICDHWPATMPPDPEHLHIIVEPPSGEVGGAASQLQRYNTIHTDAHKLWPVVTIKAIARGSFGGRASLGRNEIVELSGTEPEFLTQFITELERPWVVSDTVCFF
jgi:hypothetical protein